VRRVCIYLTQAEVNLMSGTVVEVNGDGSTTIWSNIQDLPSLDLPVNPPPELEE
jgi:hypothetical protein